MSPLLHFDRHFIRRTILISSSLLLILTVSVFNTGYSKEPKEPIQQEGDVSITGVTISKQQLKQGDVFTMTVQVQSKRYFDYVTASFLIIDNSSRIIAKIETDFIELQPGDNQELNFDFKWSDLSDSRVGNLRISQTHLKQYFRADQVPRNIASYHKTIPIRISAVKDRVHRMYISRENSIWWVTKMGLVNTDMARENNLGGCIMFGGNVETWIRNDYLIRTGNNARCYWEVTGYVIRVLALEHERTSNPLYLKLAQRAANTVLLNIKKEDSDPSLGSLPVYTHFDGRMANAYQGQVMLFDLGQLLMGLLELRRVMDNSGYDINHWQPYAQAAKSFGDFMLHMRDLNSGLIPSTWTHKTKTTSGDYEPTAKVIIGFKQLVDLTKDLNYQQAALDHLNTLIAKSEPFRNADHHGRSYMAYGFLRSFLDYNDVTFLEAAKTWNKTVVLDMDNDGQLRPNEDYSAIPAQSQLIRNNIILWELTGEDRFQAWAERSASFLSNASEPWTYRQSILKLGRFYREAGGQFNNIPSDEVTSWGSLFHIDAMYHFLRLSYGHVFSVPGETISIIGPVKVNQRPNSTELTLQGLASDNIGIYIGTARTIQSVHFNGKHIPYHSKHTARLPVFDGMGRVRIEYGEAKPPYLLRTNSLIYNIGTLGETMNITVKGRLHTTGRMSIRWPTPEVKIVLNGKQLQVSQWSWGKLTSELVIRYKHTGLKQNFTISPNN